MTSDKFLTFVLFSISGKKVNSHHPEGAPLAAEGQVLLPVEGEVLHPDAGLPPVFQEGHVKDHGDGRVHLQGN